MFKKAKSKITEEAKNIAESITDDTKEKIKKNLPTILIGLTLTVTLYTAIKSSSRPINIIINNK